MCHYLSCRMHLVTTKILYLVVVVIVATIFQCSKCYGSTIVSISNTIINCTQIQEKIDQYPTLLAMDQQLCVEQRSFLGELFQCLNSNNSITQQRLPTAIISNSRSFIYGHGWSRGKIYAKQPSFKWIRNIFNNLIWQGKVFWILSDGRVRTANIIPLLFSMLGNADVYHLPSIIDGGDSIIVDYRIDTTVPIISPVLSTRFRDELREIIWRGNKSEIYLGQAFLFTGTKSQLMNNTEYQIKSNWDDGIYFLMDVRAAVQNELPQWAIRKYS
jgi:hypothetical protein